MKRHTPLEIFFIVAAFIFLILKISFDRESIYYKYFPFGLYFFTGLVATSKTLRFFETLNKTNKIICVISVFLIHSAALGTLIFENKDLNVIWIFGVLLFTIGGQNILQKQKI